MDGKPRSEATAPAPPLSMKARQAPLVRQYREDPDEGWIVDSASTASGAFSPDDPIHTQVTFGHSSPATQAMRIHRKVGGECDFPNTGEMLAAALASCLDTTTRIIANNLGIHLERLEVSVDARVDKRGTLRVDDSVPVGYQSIDVRLAIDAGKDVTEVQIDRLVKAAEHSCIVMQPTPAAADQPSM